jgi:hypothetical protein
VCSCGAHVTLRGKCPTARQVDNAASSTKSEDYARRHGNFATDPTSLSHALSSPSAVFRYPHMALCQSRCSLPASGMVLAPVRIRGLQSPGGARNQLSLSVSAELPLVEERKPGALSASFLLLSLPSRPRYGLSTPVAKAPPTRPWASAGQHTATVPQDVPSSLIKCGWATARVKVTKGNGSPCSAAGSGVLSWQPSRRCRS